MPSELLVSLHRPPINLLLSAPVIPMTLNVFRMKWPTDIPLLLQTPGLPSIQLTDPCTSGFSTPHQKSLSSHGTVSSNNIACFVAIDQMTLLGRLFVKNSFFIFGLSSSANIFYKLTSTLYAGFLSFLTFFYKVDKFKAFSLFFVVLKFHSYVCKDVGETSYTDFILKCSLHSIFHISFHPNSIQLFTLQVQPAFLFLHYSCSRQSSIFLQGPHFSVYQLPFALDGYSPLFFC